MKSYATILIVESNQYFSRGFMHGLLKHFDSLEIPIMFTHSLVDKSIADVVFMAAELEGAQLRYLAQRETAPPYQHIYLFKERPAQADKVLYKALNGIFYRYQSLDWAVQIVAQALRNISVTKTRYRRARPAIPLTEREREILSYLSKGQRSCDISRRLRISQKTVSGHKRNAMEKLGLSRSSDLNYWLLHGGINQLAHTASPGVRPMFAYRAFSSSQPHLIPSLPPLRAE
ncbi:helix-turn-helix domain-containing protein [Serratia sp. NA_112.1]|uniref:helix-turn-helix domain-containing protein n=1 Tax=unclassified Serratia (in: enterobacteria) TaxID=2647522 RepID=UPI004046BB04